MNLKTGIMAASIAFAPMSSKAQTAVKTAKPVVIEQIARETQDSVLKAQTAYGKAAVKSILAETSSKKAAPAAIKTPDLSKANSYNANHTMHYDEYGNADSLFNNKKQAYRTIQRTKNGTLEGYSDYTYKKNGNINTETIYYNAWGKKGKIDKVETHKYNGNGTATVIDHNQKGEPEFVTLRKTEKYNGKEVIPDDPNMIIDDYTIDNK